MKKFFKIALWAILLVVIVCIVAITVFVKTFDLNKYKNQITQIVYDQTGRQLSIDGHAGLKISLIPTIELNDVKFSNADWAKEPNMVEAKTIDVAFSILPLLKKEIVIDKIHLIEPKVYLTINEKGVPNWEFVKYKKTGEVKESKNTISEKDVAKGVAIASVVAKSFKIENGIVLYQDLKTKSIHELKIKQIGLTSEGVDSEISADIDVVYNNEEIKADIVAGSINSILQNTSKYLLKADVKAFGVTATVDAILSNILTNIGYDASLTLVNPSGNFGIPSVKLKANAQGDLQNIVLNLSSLNVASNEIKGVVKANLSGKKTDINATLNSNMIDLLKFSEINTASDRFSIISKAHAATFVPATEIDLSMLNLLNANIELNIGKLIVNKDIMLDNIKTDVVINSGNANINIKQMQVGGGNLVGSINADTSNKFKVNLNGTNIVLQDFLKFLSITDNKYFGIASGGNTDLLINLTSKGRDLQSVVENLDGQFIAIVGDSKIQTGTLKYLSGGLISQILSSLKLQKLDKTLDVSCAVVRTDIANGKAIFPKGIAFKSNKLIIVSDGSVNLKNDKIDFSIRPFNGKISDANITQAISSMLKISGTVSKPYLTLDNSSIIKNVVGVVATGPVFLGSQLLMDVDEYPCYTALKGTSYEKMFPAPSGVKATGQGVYQGARDVVGEGVDLITGAAKGVINILTGKK